MTCEIQKNNLEALNKVITLPWLCIFGSKNLQKQGIAFLFYVMAGCQILDKPK